MTEQTETPTTVILDRLERVTVASDGGVGRRGWTSVVYLKADDAAWFKAELAKRRAL